MKAPRNKTIDMSIEEGKDYLERCLTIEHPVDIPQIVNKTLYGDTFSVLNFLPKQFVNLAIIDPPYNLNKNFHGRSFRRSCDQDYLDYTEQWILALKPLLAKSASLYVCCDWQSSMIIGALLKKHFHVQNRITWQREKGRGAKNNWKNAMEDIWFVTNEKEYTFNVDAIKIRRKVVAPYRVKGVPKGWEETAQGNFRNTFPSNFWDDISIPYWSMPENTAHPTQKPEKLLAKLILASSHAGDIVLDPFLGSGSTSVVAKKLGRKYIGIEHNAQYCIWAEKRLEMATEHTEIQGYNDGIFWERNSVAAQKALKAPVQKRQKQKKYK